MKKILLTGVSAIVLAWSVPAFAELNGGRLFQWVDGSVKATESKTSFGITAFRTLSESSTSLTYTQLGVSNKKSKNTLNLGLGLRALTTFGGMPTILGGNVFFDAKDGNKRFWSLSKKESFQRVSLGLELKTAIFDTSANWYRPVSKGIIKDQKVLKGWDATVKGKVPGINGVAVGISTYKFTGTNGNTDEGNKAIVKFKPMQALTIKVEYDKPKGEKAKTKIAADFVFMGANSTSKNPNAPDVWAKRYDKVDRRYEVLTENVIQSAAIAGTASSTSAVWGAAITPNYNLPTEVVQGDIRESFTASDYTFTIKEASDTLFASGENNDAVNFDSATGAIKANRTTKQGVIVVTVTRAAKGLLAAQSKDVALTVNRKDNKFAVATGWASLTAAEATGPRVGSTARSLDIDTSSGLVAESMNLGAGNIIRNGITVTLLDPSSRSSVTGVAQSANITADFVVTVNGAAQASTVTNATLTTAIQNALRAGQPVTFAKRSGQNNKALQIDITMPADGVNLKYNAKTTSIWLLTSAS